MTNKRFPCKHNCGKTYAANGACLRKHEDSCSHGLSSATFNHADTGATTTEPKSRLPCLHCGKFFVNPIKHMCKARNCIPGAVFNFRDSFFELNDSLNNSADNSLFLNTAFTSDKASNVSPLMKDVIEFTSSNKNSFKVGLLNINSLHSKMHEISFILEKSLLDIFVLNETKLDHTIDSADYEMNQYHMFRRDRSRHGGGMIVYVKKGY